MQEKGVGVIWKQPSNRIARFAITKEIEQIIHEMNELNKMNEMKLMKWTKMIEMNDKYSQAEKKETIDQKGK